MFMPSDKVMVREVAGELVLMDLGSEQFFRLNDTGAIVWQGIVDGHTERDIAGGIAERFSISMDQAEGDVRELLESLAAAGLITGQ